MAKNKKNGIHPILTIAAIVAVTAMLAYSIWGGRKERDIIGTWVTDTSGTESGFQCGRHGIAASINNSTCQYNNWKISKSLLILSGKEFKDNRVNPFSDTMAIKKLNSKQLIVDYHGRGHSYRKIR